MDEIRRLYLSILQREADPDGLYIYSKILKETGSLEHIVKILKGSEEFKALESCVPIDYDIVEVPKLCEQMIPHTVYDLVVSRFDESTNWVPRNAILYNKGERMVNSSLKEIIPLKNEGREGETYLHHIIQNYDNLCEYTIFTQADPFKHNPTFVQDLFDNMDKGEVFRSFGKWWQKEYPPDNIIEGGIRPNIHIGNRDFVCIHPTFWEDDGWVRIVRRIKMRNHIDYIIPWVCRRLDLVEPTTGVPISMCGMFGVHRSKIQMYSKSFYEKMRDFLLEHPDHGYVIERFWATLFLLGCAQTE
tara:strand:- start:3750 stop:4655 length:906 start_codon:yes stop_codon:yes gene_type:complete